MKHFLLAIMIYLTISCKKTENCVKDFVIKRTYDAPAPDNITFKAKLSKEYKDKISDDFCHVIFHINEKDSFITHDVIIYNEKDFCDFSINTTYFNRKRNFTEADFDKLSNSSDSLILELIYDHTDNKFTFTKCR